MIGSTTVKESNHHNRGLPGGTVTHEINMRGKTVIR